MLQLWKIMCFGESRHNRCHHPTYHIISKTSVLYKCGIENNLPCRNSHDGVTGHTTHPVTPLIPLIGDQSVARRAVLGGGRMTAHRRGACGPPRGTPPTPCLGALWAEVAPPSGRSVPGGGPATSAAASAGIGVVEAGHVLDGVAHIGEV